jgi:hypothetical protein
MKSYKKRDLKTSLPKVPKNDFLGYIIVKSQFLILELKITLNSVWRVITTIVDYQEF